MERRSGRGTTGADFVAGTRALGFLFAMAAL